MILCNDIGAYFPTFPQFQKMLREYERDHPLPPPEPKPERDGAAWTTPPHQMPDPGPSDVRTPMERRLWWKQDYGWEFTKGLRIDDGSAWLVWPDGWYVRCQSRAEAERVITAHRLTHVRIVG